MANKPTQLQKKDVPSGQITKEQTFWDWFSKKQEQYFDFEKNQEKLFDELNTKLNDLDENLTFEFSFKHWLFKFTHNNILLSSNFW